MMNAMLISSGLPQNFWGEALLSENYILNKLPHKKLDKTLYSLWKGRSFSYKYLKVWGCLAKVMVPIPKRIKIGPKTIDCIFIGYTINSNAYRFLSKNACDGSSLKRTHDTTTSDIDHESINDESKETLRRSKRARTSKSFGPDFLTYLLENEPQSFIETISTPEAPMWKEAVNSEIESIMQNHTWELVDLPPRSKPLGCKWIFKRKMKTNGSIDKYKARLVEKGYEQKKGLDYFDTYSYVTRIRSIRMLIVITALHNLEIHQMDVKTTFLNGDLNEEIYIDQPEGFISLGQEKKVCKLVKSLYGLKKAPK